MKLLLKELNTPYLTYDLKCDPTRQQLSEKELWQEEFTKREWTIGARAVSMTRKRLSHPENKSEPKAKKTKEKNQEKPISFQRNDCSGGEGSKQVEVVDSIKVEVTGDEEISKEKLVNQPGTILKQEPTLLQGENGSL